ncbi:MAG: hypothetical protein H0W74_08315 [Sphingosinicella sp.]|nr:hypothetical protein [Sphingosinicella sp.]
MTISRNLLLVGVLALGGCEARIGANDSVEAADVSAGAQAEEDMVTVKAPGVDIKVNIPKSVRNRASVEGDSELIYPGSKVGGIQIKGGSGDQDDAVVLRFSSLDAPAKIVDWYLDPARTDFKIDSEAREGSVVVLNGHDTDDNSRFRLRLGPGGKGTDGILSIQD